MKLLEFSSGLDATSESTILLAYPRRTTLHICIPKCRSCESLASGAMATFGSVQNSMVTSYVSVSSAKARKTTNGGYSKTGIFKQQIDWIPLSSGAVRPTQGRTLAVAQVSGGSQSFNAVNSLRILGRWMRMFAIPNQSSVPKAYTQFTPEEDGSRMIPSSNRDRLVDYMEELVKYTIVMRPYFDLFGDRFSERENQDAKN